MGPCYLCGMHARIAGGHLVQRNCCRSTAEATLLFVWNARTHCQGAPCVEKSLSVDCRDDPVICVKRTHALPGTAWCREIVVGRLQRRLCYLCGTHARIARDRLGREIVVGRLQRRPCYLCGTHACIVRGHLV